MHKIFGIANVTRAIKTLDFAAQQYAIKSFIWEAKEWVKDNVHGPYAEVGSLQDRIKSLEEENQNLQYQLISQWKNNGVANFSPENATLNNANNYVGVLGRGFVQGVNPSNNFNDQNGCFVREVEERERGSGSSSGAIYGGGFGLGRGRGYDGVWSGSSTIGDLPRGGERVRVFGHHDGIMQYAASRSSSLVDYNQNNINLPGN